MTVHISTSLLGLEKDSRISPFATHPNNDAADNFDLCKELCLHGYTCRPMDGWRLSPAGKARSPYQERRAHLQASKRGSGARVAVPCTFLSRCRETGTTIGLLTCESHQGYPTLTSLSPVEHVRGQPTGEALAVDIKGPIARLSMPESEAFLPIQNHHSCKPHARNYSMYVASHNHSLPACPKTLFLRDI